jgi:hypothetical protein
VDVCGQHGEGEGGVHDPRSTTCESFESSVGIACEKTLEDLRLYPVKCSTRECDMLVVQTQNSVGMDEWMDMEGREPGRTRVSRFWGADGPGRACERWLVGWGWVEVVVASCGCAVVSTPLSRTHCVTPY